MADKPETAMVAKVVNGALTLPETVMGWLKPGEELLVFVAGDTLILKRVQPPRLSELAEGGGEEEMPLEEIVEEVHRHRQEKRRAGGA